jgi:hypothetical protein
MVYTPDLMELSDTSVLIWALALGPLAVLGFARLLARLDPPGPCPPDCRPGSPCERCELRVI